MSLNELKPEDVMKDMEQYVHCANIMGSATLSKDEMNAIFALLREMKKQIRELDADVENYKSIAEYQQNCNVKRYHIIKEKDAEIERLKKHLDYKCIYGYDGDVMEYCVQGPCPYYKRESEVRAEAIDEFADALEKHFCHDPAFLGVEQRLIMDVVKQKAKELKGGTPNA